VNLDNIQQSEMPKQNNIVHHGTELSGIIFIELWCCSEAYTPDVLGVRRTPCETEHDVTFS